MVERGHGETRHVLRVHVGDGCGAATHPDGLTLENRDGELTDHTLHEPNTLKDGVIKL